jgi:glutathione synthetase
VRVIRRSLTALADKNVCSHARTTHESAAESPRRALIVDGHEISVVYFRAGYTPRDYPSQAEWDARLFVERTHAIKCPSIAYQLVGAKKAQQQLAAEGEVERFLGADEGLAQVRQSFAGLYEVDDASVAMVLACGGKGFVMKPQREGGGNNIYEGDIPAALASMQDAADRRAYIFMSMIRPPALPSVLVRSGVASAPQPTLSELGIFSTFLGDGEHVVRNEFAGHLLRTKPLEATEGGVASGYSVLDSPELV